MKERKSRKNRKSRFLSARPDIRPEPGRTKIIRRDAPFGMTGRARRDGGSIISTNSLCGASEVRGWHDVKVAKLVVCGMAAGCTAVETDEGRGTTIWRGCLSMLR